MSTSRWLRPWSWTLGEQVAGALIGGAMLLLAEIRFEHRAVLAETWHAWLPLVYTASLIVAGGAALGRFHRGGRQVLIGLFGAAFVVGALGVWFHSDRHPMRALGRVAAVWAGRPADNVGESENEPPPLAPAAFMGIGLVGVLACARQPRTCD